MNDLNYLDISDRQIRSLDIGALEPFWSMPVDKLLKQESKLILNIQFNRDQNDPRELSEIPECRLWSIRADALCPWLPYLLERSNGHLNRHVAMLVPHSFTQSEGIKFNPDALSLWITHRLFLLDHWSAMHGFSIKKNLSLMVMLLGYEIDENFWPE
jgi:hypothetical protein